MSSNEHVQRADDIGRHGNGISARQIGAIILVLVIVVFAIANTQDATIDFIFGDVTLPLFVVITVIGLIGFGVGWLVRSRRDVR